MIRVKMNCQWWQAGKKLTSKKDESLKQTSSAKTSKDSLQIKVSEASEVTKASEVTRADIEREKRNLNLDGFIRKLSMPEDLSDLSFIR